MNKPFTLLLCLLFSIPLFAQPPNDDCGGIIDLGTLPFCSTSTFFDNTNATPSFIGADNIPTGCDGGNWTSIDNDIWFQFTASDTIDTYQFTINGITNGAGSLSLRNAQVAIYRGDCGINQLALLTCARSDNDGEPTLEFDLNGLDYGENYIVRINSWSTTATPNWGTFNLCIEEKPPVTSISDGSTTTCTGTLVDNGGADGDYLPNTDESFTICPSEPYNQCVTFNLEYYNLDGADGLLFYDGEDASAPQIAALGGSDGGDGGTGYSVQASSGCLTIRMISDATVEFEGFLGTWECSALACETKTPVTVDITPNEEAIISNLTTPQTIVNIDTVNCAQGSFGTFVGENSGLGLDKGIVLTTGSAEDIGGRNNGENLSVENGYPGDDDLDYISSLSSGSLSQDACVVVVDVFVATDELNFDYVFASEEYPEYANSEFNDIFALLVSGPGIDGDVNINNQQNVAIIPGTTTPVEINTINPTVNWEHYRNNSNGNVSVQYDGLTSGYLSQNSSLTASVAVEPCNTYKLKFAIADRLDRQFDSGVFIGELKGGTPTLNFVSGENITSIVENCSGTEDSIVIRLDQALEEDQTYRVEIGGSATLNLDYTLNIPSEITFPAGTTELSYSIVSITDFLEEGNENITITLSSDYGCGFVDLETLSVMIQDVPEILVNIGIEGEPVDSVLVCGSDPTVELTANGVNEFTWLPSDIFDNNNAQTVNATVTESGYIHVTGQLGSLPGCIAQDSVYLELINPTMEIQTDNDLNICSGDTIFVNAVSNVENSNFTWSGNTENIDDITSPNTFIIPTSSTNEYIASVMVGGCTATDTIRMEVDPFDFPVVHNDTTICQGSPLELATPLDFTTTTYSWTPGEYLNDSTFAGAIATPQENVTYVLTATSESGFCQRIDSIQVEVVEAQIAITEDTLFVCNGNTAVINTDIRPIGTDIVWTPTEEFVSSPSASNPTILPTVNQWYFARIETDACLISDSVFVKVDSLPTTAPIARDEDKEIYCPGDTIYLTSTIFNPLQYPDITHKWYTLEGANNIRTPDSLYNAVAFAGTDTVIYVRNTINNACFTSDTVTILSVNPELEIIPDTLVCAGEPIQINATTADPQATYEWQESTDLSCLDCPNPTVTAATTTTYSLSATVFDCPTSGTYTANIQQTPSIIFNDPGPICPNTTISLNANVQPGVSYQWSGSGLNSSEVNPTVSPAQTSTYSVTATNTNGICPPATASTTIETIQPSTFEVSNDVTVCPGTEFSLSAQATPSTIVDSYTWTGPNANGLTDNNLTLSLNAAGDFVYTVDFTNGCQDFSEDIIVTINDNAQIDSLVFSPTQQGFDDCFDGGETVTLSAALSNNLDNLTYRWRVNNELIDGNSQSVPVVIPNVETAVFDVLITTPNGCESYYQLGPFCVYPAKAAVPNAFRPSIAGEAGYFNIQTTGYWTGVTTFKVWNRYGDLVYNNQTPSTGWDGTVGGKLAPADVYLYHIVIEQSGGEVREFKGDITLIR